MPSIEKILKLYPLLTHYEQLELSKKINRLVLLEKQELNWILKFNRCPTDDELATANGISVSELNEAFREGFAAKEKMILSNLRLVSWIARKYQNKKVSFQDLFQEGVFGLIIAVNRYNLLMGTTFATYAYWYILKEIQTAYFNNCRSIWLPISIYKKIS
ncbi:sigma-70 family RNA polymerase sigma factor [Nodularia sp. NIES-3585]|uniref:sigma-70 family RNA polymerase sigma factor n=1 Tax=Nodularia sp. NIES-3585 TaxID=1973477 RepID=UPI000B5D05C7|nr:sigma-70 family RNA polymerase sigma factor [Nodularia sp. NIES-3585]GAX35543.1 RNA polymerase sigma factor, group 1 [Nodularia sp. NIES-3585]